MYILLNFDNSTLVDAVVRLAYDDVQSMLSTFEDDGAVKAMYQFVVTEQLINDPSSLNGN